MMFHQVYNTMINKVGAKEVKMKSTDRDKKMVTCMLLVVSNGREAKLTVVFKGKGKTKEDKLSTREDVLVLYSSNGSNHTLSKF